MQYFKQFKSYEPQIKPFGEGVAYLQDEKGNDWYEVQSAFKANTLKVVFDSSGLIVSCSKDASALYPLDCGVLEVESEQEELLGLYVINGKLISAPKPSEYHEWNGKKWVISAEKLTALLAHRKESLLTLIANKADELKSGLLVGYPQTEIESFYRQEKEALAKQADPQAETPMLEQIARVRGVSLDVLVAKVIEKSNLFATAIGAIIGKRQAFEDRLMVIETLEELEQLEKEVNEWQVN